MIAGTPWWTVCSQRTAPLPLSRQITFHSCGLLSCTGSMSPYSPGLNELSFALIAVVTHRRSFQTIGLELPRPGIFVRQTADEGANVVGAGCPCAATPVASMPRKAGQSIPGRGARTAPPRCCAAAPMPTSNDIAIAVEHATDFVICFTPTNAVVNGEYRLSSDFSL